jgi:hypothetical protein
MNVSYINNTATTTTSNNNNNNNIKVPTSNVVNPNQFYGHQLLQPHQQQQQQQHHQHHHHSYQQQPPPTDYININVNNNQIQQPQQPHVIVPQSYQQNLHYNHHQQQQQQQQHQYQTVAPTMIQQKHQPNPQFINQPGVTILSHNSAIPGQLHPQSQPIHIQQQQQQQPIANDVVQLKLQNNNNIYKPATAAQVNPSQFIQQQQNDQNAKFSHLNPNHPQVKQQPQHKFINQPVQVINPNQINASNIQQQQQQQQQKHQNIPMTDSQGRLITSNDCFVIGGPRNGPLINTNGHQNYQMINHLTNDKQINNQQQQQQQRLTTADIVQLSLSYDEEKILNDYDR